MNPPDLIDWYERLADRLQAKDIQYRAFIAIKNGEFDAEIFGNAEVAETDAQANATLVVTSALVSVVSALSELPKFADRRGLTALHDLTAALATLDRGGMPALLRPRADAEGKKRHVDRDYVEQHAILCVELLASLPGMKRTRARATVAQIFSENGHTGRKRKAGLLDRLSAKSIWEWERKLESEALDSVRRQWLATRVQNYTSRLDWPPEQQTMLEEIARIADDPLLKTKI